MGLYRKKSKHLHLSFPFITKIKKKFKYVYMIKKTNTFLKFEIVILRQTNYRKNNKKLKK